MGIWKEPGQKLPPMHAEYYEDFDQTVEYLISEPVLAVTRELGVQVARCSVDEGQTIWFSEDGADFTVVYWTELPELPEQEETQ